jgi:hypothetical protein
MQSSCFFPDLIQTGMSSTRFIKSQISNFTKIRSVVVETCWRGDSRTEGQIGLSKLIVAFHHFTTPNILTTEGGAGDSDSIPGQSVLEKLREM